MVPLRSQNCPESGSCVQVHERDSSHPNHENCEGTTAIRNRPLRDLGRSFQLIEATRGRPFWGGAVHSFELHDPISLKTNY